MGSWAVSAYQPLWAQEEKRLLQPALAFNSIAFNFLGMCPEKELLDHMVIPFSIFWEELNTLSVRPSLLKWTRIMQVAGCVCPAPVCSGLCSPEQQAEACSQPARKAEPG